MNPAFRTSPGRKRRRRAHQALKPVHTTLPQLRRCQASARLVHGLRLRPPRPAVEARRPGSL